MAAMSEKPYPSIEYVAKFETTVLQCNRVSDKVIEVPRATPGNIILVHGVNDVGSGYSAVEEGLCQGLQARRFAISSLPATDSSARMTRTRSRKILTPSSSSAR